MRKVRAIVALAAFVAASVVGIFGAADAEATGRCELRFYDGRPSIVC